MNCLKQQLSVTPLCRRMDGIDTFAVPSLGSRVKVAIRCRPAIRSDVEDKEINYPDVVKTVDDQSGFGRVFLIHSSGKSREFIYDHAFGPECDQDSIFEAIAQPVVDYFLGGRNGTLFAYGQTGTGKVTDIFLKTDSTSLM